MTVHGVKDFVSAFECSNVFLIGVDTPGQPMWAFTSQQFSQWLQRILTLLAVPGASLFTLKAFRAGKATALAAAGYSIGDSLRAGEWSSRAFLAYIDEDAVDAAQLLQQTLAASDEEGDS